ncbi:MAG: MBL fold metallo-hydrolase RNA specificity domain-containing protein, partial [Ignavibacteriaceae bacterium]
GAKEVNIFGEKHIINCRVKIMDYFSAHADQEELIDYLRLNPKEKLKNIFLVHGEEKQSLVLREKLVTLGYRNVHFPVSGEKYEI